METEQKIKKEFDKSLPAAIVFAAVIISASFLYSRNYQIGSSTKKQLSSVQNQQASALEEAVIPQKGIELPITWGDLGKKLIETGTIDEVRFKSLYESRGNFTQELQNLLYKDNNEKIIITNENAPYILNLFWALGLGNKNEILEKGEMSDPKYGGAGNFASTGGWTLANGNPMDHYSKHELIVLTSEQQQLVDKISRGIFRPCCGNSTHFPDCNHGMAMLGLLELMASQGTSEEQMWRTALAVNSYWFPGTYLTIAQYMKSKGIEWKDVDPKEMLGSDYSSAQGFKRVSSLITTQTGSQSSSGCGVDAGVPPISQAGQQSGCSI